MCETKQKKIRRKIISFFFSSHLCNTKCRETTKDVIFLFKKKYLVRNFFFRRFLFSFLVKLISLNVCFVILISTSTSRNTRQPHFLNRTESMHVFFQVVLISLCPFKTQGYRIFLVFGDPEFKKKYFSLPCSWLEKLGKTRWK